ncbi:hypothetical protein GCM10008012_48990 [Rhizobium anhuiense]|nr:hypothetical protein GCM10008012_48990 [Rhizobium anhuiense]
MARRLLGKQMADIIGGPEAVAEDGFDAVDQRCCVRRHGALLFQRAADGAQQFGLGRRDTGPLRSGRSIRIVMGTRLSGCAIVKTASGPDIVHLRHISCT